VEAWTVESWRQATQAWTLDGQTGGVSKSGYLLFGILDLGLLCDSGKKRTRDGLEY
jgi:hypothetical protein